jgi:hypothetical protein
MDLAATAFSSTGSPLPSNPKSIFRTSGSSDWARTACSVGILEGHTCRAGDLNSPEIFMFNGIAMRSIRGRCSGAVQARAAGLASPRQKRVILALAARTVCRIFVIVRQVGFRCVFRGAFLARQAADEVIVVRECCVFRK